MKNIAMKQQCSTNAKWSMARSGCGTNDEPRNVASCESVEATLEKTEENLSKL